MQSNKDMHINYFSNLNLHYLNIYTCVNSILKRSVSMKQISLGADTEAKISILTGSNFDQYCTDRAKNYLEHWAKIKFSHNTTHNTMTVNYSMSVG